MSTVDVNYIRFFRQRTRHIEVPERWEDLRPYQFEVCAQLHVAPPTDDVFVARFFRLPKHIVRQLTKFELYKLTDLVGFAVTPDASISHFYMEEISGTKLKSPTGKLGNVTLEQFALLDTYFFKYINNPDQYKLSEFVAATYLKKNEVLTKIDFTRRVKYIENNVDKYTLYAIFLNYMFVRKWLSRCFKFLFNSDSDEEETNLRRKFKPVTKVSKPLPQWVEIIDGFVGDDILNYDNYTQMNCIRAFKVLNSRIKKFKKDGK